MARNLERQTFFVSMNNGVYGVVAADVFANLQRRAAIERRFPGLGDALLDLPTRPIFTFAKSERVVDAPWFSGTDNHFAMLRWHLEKQCGAYIEGGNFYVPFSNAHELGHAGPEVQRFELAFVTSNRQFEETFGTTLRELEKHEFFG